MELANVDLEIQKLEVEAEFCAKTGITAEKLRSIVKEENA